jgi:hypothetical protein
MDGDAGRARRLGDAGGLDRIGEPAAPRLP